MTITRIHAKQPIKIQHPSFIIKTNSTGKLLSHIIKLPSLSAQKVDIPSTLNSKKCEQAQKRARVSPITSHDIFCRQRRGSQQFMQNLQDARHDQEEAETTERLKIFSRKIDGYFYTPNFYRLCLRLFSVLLQKKNKYFKLNNKKIKTKKSKKKIPQSETSFFCLLP